MKRLVDYMDKARLLIWDWTTVLWCSVLLGLLVIILYPEWANARDRNVALEFQRQNPCPATGKPAGPCPGWVRDHVVPLCKGGPDTVANLQWQTVEDAKAKDRWECKP